MILLKDLKAVLKEDIFIIIDFGEDNNNLCNLTPYEEKYNDYTVTNINIINENHIGVNIL